LRGGRLSRTKYILRNTPDAVTITRRHHPLEGQQVEVVQGGRQRITIRLADGTTTRIPRGWTSADGTAGDRQGWREGVFTEDSMRRLFALLDAFGRRSPGHHS
jgi:hypothetical protein